MITHPIVTVTYRVTGLPEPLIGVTYHVPRVGDRIELPLRRPDELAKGETIPLVTGSVTEVMWGPGGATVEVLNDVE